MSAAGNGALRRAVREDAVDARLAHLVIALWVDEEAHIGVEVARRLAHRADVLVGVSEVLLQAP